MAKWRCAAHRHGLLVPTRPALPCTPQIVAKSKAAAPGEEEAPGSSGKKKKQKKAKAAAEDGGSKPSKRQKREEQPAKPSGEVCTPGMGICLRFVVVTTDACGRDNWHPAGPRQYSRAVEKLRGVCKAATITIPPNIYVKHKTDEELQAALQALLDKHGLDAHSGGGRGHRNGLLVCHVLPAMHCASCGVVPCPCLPCRPALQGSGRCSG